MTCATLQLMRYGGSNTGNVIYALFEVSTPAATLNNNQGASSSICADLGTGTKYGAYTVSTAGDSEEVLSFALNPAAIAAINASGGSYFSIGGSLLDSTGGEYLGGTPDNFLYAFSGHAAQRLVVGGAGDTCPTGNQTPVNRAPTVDPVSGDSSADEGDRKAYSVSASDPDGDALSYAWSVTAGNAVIDGTSTGSSVDVSFTDGPSTVELKVEVSDGQGDTVTRTKTISEANVAPTIGPLTLGGASATACIAGNDVELAFGFTDPAGANDTQTGTIDWGDGSSSAAFGSSPVEASHHYEAGNHTIKVDVSDEDGDAAAQKTGAVSLLYDMSSVLAPTGSTSAADTTGQMRYSAEGAQYIYNLSTAGLAAGNWTIYVRQAESSPGQVKANVYLK